jgi:hypothetical protein
MTSTDELPPSPPPPLPEERGEYSVRIPRFAPATHGFPFPNWFPPRTPVFTLPTPFGTIPIGDAHNGLCGGMIFTAMDLYHFDLPVPQGHSQPLFGYFARRLIESWNLPFGALKYYDWQLRPLASHNISGVRITTGLTVRTVEQEWPRIRADLDAGLPVALGVVKVSGWDIRKIAQNHQVMAYGYDLDEEKNEVTIRIYDPNYPGDEASLTLNLANPDNGSAILHSSLSIANRSMRPKYNSAPGYRTLF